MKLWKNVQRALVQAHDDARKAKNQSLNRPPLAMTLRTRDKILQDRLATDSPSGLMWTPLGLEQQAEIVGLLDRRLEGIPIAEHTPEPGKLEARNGSGWAVGDLGGQRFYSDWTILLLGIPPNDGEKRHEKGHVDHMLGNVRATIRPRFVQDVPRNPNIRDVQPVVVFSTDNGGSIRSLNLRLFDIAVRKASPVTWTTPAGKGTEPVTGWRKSKPVCMIMPLAVSDERHKEMKYLLDPETTRW